MNTKAKIQALNEELAEAQASDEMLRSAVRHYVPMLSEQDWTPNVGDRVASSKGLTGTVLAHGLQHDTVLVRWELPTGHRDDYARTATLCELPEPAACDDDLCNSWHLAVKLPHVHEYEGRGARVVERAKVAAHGYVIERYGKGWVLKDPDGAELMIGDHGCVAPTRWECIAEAVARIEQDERLAARTRDCDDPTCPDCGKPIRKNPRSGQGLWNHVDDHGDCWRISYDGPAPDVNTPNGGWW
jgi:hypothetical protein